MLLLIEKVEAFRIDDILNSLFNYYFHSAWFIGIYALINTYNHGNFRLNIL